VRFRALKVEETKMRIDSLLEFCRFRNLVLFSYQTGGLIDNRYANKDALGREIQSTDWSDIAQTEWIMCLDHPFVGVGVEGQGRTDRSNWRCCCISGSVRLLAEHGMLGESFNSSTPLVLFFENKFNLYLLSFMFKLNNQSCSYCAVFFIPYAC
jgi:hypothetical protein